ncbi:MAG: MBL fold metallo-hydrolase [Gemmatimonadota bacterium]|nr:MBL fold metallo-hydrolase [Gemmatimonadota bacterium]
MPTPTVRFLGAAGTVTGSKHLVDTGRSQVLLDCGLFQGLKQLRERNWAPPPIAAGEFEAVVLSHAHIDHSGYLPVLARHGFQGPIYCTPATADLLRLLLPDSAHLQEEQAEYANFRGFSRHKPALPLCTMEDAHAALELLRPRPYGTTFDVTEDVRATFHPAGHILGSAIISLDVGRAPHRLVFSGDLGRWDRPVLPDPTLIDEADVLLVESTYGNRAHPPDPVEGLARVVRDAAKRGGALIIPAFAVGRTQEILWHLRQLEEQNAIPVLPVYIDSPMAIEATDVYRKHREDYDEEMLALVDRGGTPFRTRQFATAPSRQDSIRLNDLVGPVIIISASGMVTGGRVLHHMNLRLPDPRTTVLLVGFQAQGTRGRAMQEGKRDIRMFGREVTVRAKVETLDGMSAHADQGEILRWLGGFKRPPHRTYLVHAEPSAADALHATISRTLGWSVRPAVDGETIPLGNGAT